MITIQHHRLFIYLYCFINPYKAVLVSEITICWQVLQISCKVYCISIR